MVALAELFTLYSKGRKESTARPTTCNHRAGPEQEASCEPAVAKNTTANLRELSYVDTDNKFRTARFFCGEPGAAQYRAAKSCNFSGVNIENTFRKALIFDIPVKKVSAQIQNTPRTRN